MVDPNDAELRAMEQAGYAGGEFITALGHTDMARWSERQWHDFVAAICGGYVDALVAEQAEIHAAAAKVRTAA